MQAGESQGEKDIVERERAREREKRCMQRAFLLHRCSGLLVSAVNSQGIGCLPRPAQQNRTLNNNSLYFCHLLLLLLLLLALFHALRWLTCYCSNTLPAPLVPPAFYPFILSSGKAGCCEATVGTAVGTCVRAYARVRAHF